MDLVPPYVINMSSIMLQQTLRPKLQTFPFDFNLSTRTTPVIAGTSSRLIRHNPAHSSYYCSP